MSTDNEDQNSTQADEVEAREVKDAPMRRSEEDAEHENPEVPESGGHEKVYEEEVDSFKKWEQDETE